MGLTQLDELFMAETMTGEVERFAEQSRERSFVEVYEGADQIRPIGEDFTYDETRYSRDLARIAGAHSPTKPGRALGVTKRAGTVYKISEHVDLPATLLMQARGLGSMGPDPRGWLNKNLKNLTNKVQRTRNHWAAQSFLTQGGAVDLGAFPNTDLPGSTVLTYPVGDLDSGASWGIAATDIRGTEIPAIRKSFERNSGMPAGCALASDTVEGYIVTNDGLSVPIDRNANLQQRKIENSYLEGGAVMRLGGIDFKYARDFHALEATPDTFVDTITDPDLVAILPPEHLWSEAFAQVEGAQYVPTGAITSMATGDPLSLISEVRGWGAYLELVMNPIGLKLHVFWAGNFVHLVQKACLVYDTTP